MSEVKKAFKSVFHLTLASIVSFGVYFFLAIIFKGALDEYEGGTFDWVMFVILILNELAFCGIYYWIHFHKNEELEGAFQREYRDILWSGSRVDLTRAIKSEKYTYAFVFLIEVIAVVIVFLGVRNPVATLYFPIAGLLAIMHPIPAVLVHLAIFLPLHILMTCRFRKKFATERGGVDGTYGIETYVRARQAVSRENRFK